MLLFKVIVYIESLKLYGYAITVQFGSIAQLCPTLCDPMNCSTPGLPVHQQLPSSLSILGTYWPGEFLFQYPITLPFHTVHGVLKARMLKWFAIPFSSGPHCVRPLHMPTCLGWPHTAWLSFIELDKAVVLVWLDWLVFCDYGFSITISSQWI